jgi:hypothetical protein
MRRRSMMTALFAWLAACADFEGITSSTGGLPDEVIEAPQFARDIRPIFERRCGIGGCHSEASKQAGLTLTRDSAYSAMVGVPSRLFVGEVLVRPGDANNSWVVIAIRDDVARRRGLARMPLGSGALTPNQIQNIVNWINRGAPDD